MNIRGRWFAALVSAILAMASMLTLTVAPVAAVPAAPCSAGTYSTDGLQPCTAIPAAFTTAGCWTLTVPAGSVDVDIDAIGAAGSNGSGLGDEITAHAAGLTDGAQLRVCVDQGGGTGGSAGVTAGGNGGGASGVSAGSDFSHPFVIAGAGGGGGGGYYGGDAGLPDAQVGVNGGGGGSNTSSSGGAGGPAFYPGTNNGSDGAGFDANGPGPGGDGGAAQDIDNARGGGGGGGGGYYGGGGGGNGSNGGGGGGGGGTSFCAGTNVTLTVSDCARTAHGGTDTVAGSGPGQAKVALAFHTLAKCAPGTYSPDGHDAPVACQPIPAAFTTAGCWTLTVPDNMSTVSADVIGGAGGQGYEPRGGYGDEVTGRASGLVNDDQLRVCVDQGGGDAGGNFYFQGGGASGVSFGTDFSQPFIVAGGGGASSVGQGGDAGMPTGQTGGGSGPGTGGDNTADQGGTGGLSNGFTNGGDGQAFTAAGPGTGGSGGVGSIGSGDYHGGAGGAGYYGGGGAGGGSDGSSGTTVPGGGGGGTSYCGSDNVSLSVSGCERTSGVGTDASAGSGAGEAKVTLTFTSAPATCAPGYYSNSGTEPCTAADPGYYATGPGADHQSPCPLGYYQPNSAQSGCLSADPGHYADTVGATAQSACVAGYYQDGTAQIDCKPADVGYYVDTTGAAAATACPSGETTTSTASTSSADCHPATASYQPDGMIRLSGYPRVGANVYSSDGTGETLTLRPARYRIGAGRTFYLYFQNDGSGSDSFTVLATGTDEPGYVVTYRRASGKDVTSAVEAGTFTTPVLEAGRTYAIRIKVKIEAGAGHGSLVQRLIEVTSTGDASQLDAVVFVLQRR